MIMSFGNAGTEDIFHGVQSKDVAKFPPEIQRTAKRKLTSINAAVRLDDLKVPPGNKLEALAGDLKGKHSIRINDQWRIVFRWESGKVYEVCIVDYH